MIKTLLEYLHNRSQTQAKISSMTASKLQKYAYKSLEEFVIKHGQFYTPAPRPKRLRLGIPRHCFHNSFNLAKRHKWIYVEGFALSVIPVLHAWCVKPDSNQVIDITWDEPGTEYIGVPFNWNYVKAHRHSNDCLSLIDNWSAEWPLLEGADNSWKY